MIPQRSRLSKIRTACILLGLGLAGPLHAHTEPGAKGAAKGEAVTPLAAPPAKQGTHDARTYFTDTELLTQDAKRVRFYSDAMQGRTVLINVVYTNCKDACPLITQKLIRVRALLGESFGREVFFLTLTSDPERDSPAMLKRFAGAQGADVPGWSWLTGPKAGIETVLKRLGQFSKTVEEHSTLLIAGNVPAKRWSKIRPDAPAEAIAQRLRLLAEGTAPGDRRN